MRCPRSAIIGEEAYREQLIRCGYAHDSIVFRDISDRVFADLVGYLMREEHELGRYGIPLGGKFKVARSTFGCFIGPTSSRG